MIKKGCTILLSAVILFFCLTAFSGCSNSNANYVMPTHLQEAEVKTNERFIFDKSTLDMLTINESVSVQLDEMEKIITEYERLPNMANADKIVKMTFDAAVTVLKTYVPKDASEFEKVHIIHDYLTSKIYYDADLYNDFLNGGAVSNSHESFLSSGVLLYKKGVCDGITRAFNLLCGIEGIKSYRIVGDFNDNENRSLHAWNKVRVDEVWYNVDVTMDNTMISLSDSEEIYAFHHGFFLLSDKSISEIKLGKHTFGNGELNPVNYPALIDYNAQAVMNQPSTELSEEKMLVSSQEELNALMEKVSSSNKKVRRLEVELKFPKYSESDSLNYTAYARELLEAYKSIKNPYFMFDLTSKMYPYVRYPNGVFVLLFYK